MLDSLPVGTPMQPEPKQDLPAQLWNWAGHKSGGVKRLFHAGSGRPTGQVVRTPLLARLEQWATSLALPKSGCPRGVILVGGPGNGKTEAVEFAVEALDAALGADGALRDSVAALFVASESGAPPRMARVDVGGITGGKHPWSLGVVQDASAPDPSAPGVALAELLLGELEAVMRSGGQLVYLACVNRGVLDDALVLANDEGRAEAGLLLQQMVASVGQSLDATSCWPVQGFASIATWPMDVESLLVPAQGQTGSAARQLLSVATDASRWPAPGQCAAGDTCPHCTSRTLLDAEPHRGSLLQVLRWFELATGKRWSFRDLFSLLSYLLAGAPDESKARAKGSPCEVAARLQQLATGSAAGSKAQRLAAPFLLASAQYHHALFGRWAPHGAGAYWACLGDLKMRDHPVLAGLHHFLARPRARSIPHTLASQLNDLCAALDPALAPPDASLQLNSSRTILFRDLDVRFSHSTRQGFEYLRKSQCLTKLDADLLARLADADDEVAQCEMARRYPEAVSRAQGWVRDFACRFTRRALGVRAAATRDAAILADFEQLSAGDPALLHEATKQVDSLLNEGEHFTVSLNTTFGEPQSPVERRAVLHTTRQRVRSREWPVGDRPRPPVRFLEVGPRGSPHSIALTYELYRAVRELGRGLHPASLPRPVVALLDTTRARLAGAVVRNEENLEDGQIRIGNRSEYIARELGQFIMQQE
jgi:hypothetical protein